MDFQSFKTSLKNSETNYLYFTIILIITIFGLNILLASSSFLASQAHGDAYYYFKKQVIYALIAVIILIIFIQIPYTFWYHAAWPIYLISILLLALVFLPYIGKSAGGAYRWIQIGPLTLQPSDLAKFSVILLLSRIFSNTQKSGNTKIAASLIIIFLPVSLIGLEPDYGTAIHLVIAAFLLLFLTDFPLSAMGIVFITSLPAIYLSIRKVTYIWERLSAYLDPYKYRYERAYQLIASYRSFLAGGTWGKGLGEGIRRHNLQARHTDFIAAIVAEDLGFAGIFLLLLLYFSFAAYGLFKLSQVENNFGRLLGTGILILFITQTMMNLAVVFGVMPTTGINLPLFSYGGTSILTYMSILGIVLNIMRDS
ncbi:MAG: FtsW/RodA/SpoVE family cell cycle protein [Spirochaetia bacterium]|nr:FtsW/RodA/SpoVE family cell cycle protein [Spirochaetia bacterium]